MRLNRLLYTLPLRLRSLFRGRQVDRELDDEMQYHLERLIQENIARGLSPEDARYAALRAMDGLTQNREKARDTRKVNGILHFARDVRYALRVLRKSPGFSTIAILTLALGIGANSAIFSVVNAMLLRPLPFPDPDKLVRLWEAQPKNGWHRNVVNAWNFLDWREHTHSFQDMAAVMGSDMNVTGQGEPFAVPGASVSPSFFPFWESSHIWAGHLLLTTEFRDVTTRWCSVSGCGKPVMAGTAILQARVSTWVAPLV